MKTTILQLCGGERQPGQAYISRSRRDDPPQTPSQAEVETYWQSKVGLCQGCNAEIAREDQYCDCCSDFLLETRRPTNP
jgi:predicted amidophosphoribosyltransferase